MAVSPGELQDIVLYQSEDSQADVPDDDRKHTMPAFDLDSWIAHYCLELGSVTGHLKMHHQWAPQNAPPRDMNNLHICRVFSRVPKYFFF